MAMKAVRLAGTVLALGVIMAGCGDDRRPDAATSPTAGQQSPASSSPGSETIAPRGTGGEPGGLTIRYLDTEKKIKTLRVEDFPH
jgi:hypothetical protein